MVCLCVCVCLSVDHVCEQYKTAVLWEHALQTESLTRVRVPKALCIRGDKILWGGGNLGGYRVVSAAANAVK